MRKRILCIAMVIVLAVALVACGGESLSEVGTWELTEVSFRTITQGKLASAAHTTLTIYSDNTYVMTNVYDTMYSSDGGETYNPVSYVNSIVYGTYETVETNEELGETTIKLTSITRVVNGDYDSDVSASDADKEAMANCEVVGTELILISDHKLSQIVDVTATMRIGQEEE